MRKKLADWFFPAAGPPGPRAGHAHDPAGSPYLPIEQMRMPVMLVSDEDDPYWTAEVVRAHDRFGVHSGM